MNWIKNNIKSIIVFIQTIVIIGLLLLLYSCKTFDPVQLENETKPCNGMYSAMRVIVKTGAKDMSLATLLSTKCMESWDNEKKKARDKNCSDRIYGKDNLIDRKDEKSYIRYLECLMQ